MDEVDQFIERNDKKQKFISIIESLKEKVGRSGQ
jgi:hypothetical protein